MNPAREVPAQRFRPRRRDALVWFLWGLPFALVAVLWPWSIGPERMGLWLGLVMAGSAACCCVFMPVVMLSSVVIVGPSGIAKSRRWNGGFSAEWSQLRSWTITRPPNWHDAPKSSRSVRFQLEGWRRAPVVFNVEVGRPGFSAFVEVLRAYAGDREVVSELTASKKS